MYIFIKTGRGKKKQNKNKFSRNYHRGEKTTWGHPKGELTSYLTYTDNQIHFWRMRIVWNSVTFKNKPQNYTLDYTQKYHMVVFK